MNRSTLILFSFLSLTLSSFSWASDVPFKKHFGLYSVLSCQSTEQGLCEERMKSAFITLADESQPYSATNQVFVRVGENDEVAYRYPHSAMAVQLLSFPPRVNAQEILRPNLGEAAAYSLVELNEVSLQVSSRKLDAAGREMIIAVNRILRIDGETIQVNIDRYSNRLDQYRNITPYSVQLTLKKK